MQSGKARRYVLFSLLILVLAVAAGLALWNWLYLPTTHSNPANNISAGLNEPNGLPPASNEPAESENGAKNDVVRQFFLNAPEGWNAAKHCRVRGVHLSSGVVGSPAKPHLENDQWVVHAPPDWPEKLTVLVIEYLSDGTSDFERFCEAFVLGPRPATPSTVTLSPPAAITSVAIMAEEAETGNALEAKADIFGNKRQAVSLLANRCVTTGDSAERVASVNALVVALKSDLPMFRLGSFVTPLELGMLEIGTTCVVSAEADGYLPTTSSFTVTGSDERIKLTRTTSLLVTAIDPLRSQPNLDRLEFGLSYEKNEVSSTAGVRRMSSNEMLFFGLETGQVIVTASQGRRWIKQEVRVEAGFNSVTLELPKVPRDPLLRLELADSEGNPISGLRITARSAATGQMRELIGTGGTIEEWSAECITPLELIVTDPWGRLIQTTDDPIPVKESGLRLTLKVANVHLSGFLRVRFETDPKLVRELVYSVWADRRPSFVGESVPEPTEFHAKSASIVVRNDGIVDIGEIPVGKVVVRAIGRNGALGTAREIPVRPESAVDGVITESIPTPGSAVASRLVKFVDEASGRPLPAGLRLMLDRVAYSPRWLILGQGGMLTIDNLTEGVFNLSFVGEEFSPIGGESAFVLDTSTDPGEIVYSAREGGRASATIVFENNEVAWIQIEPTDNELQLKPWRFDVSKDGTVSIQNIREGTYRIGVARRDEANVPHVLRLYFPAGDASYRVRMTETGWIVSKRE